MIKIKSYNKFKTLAIREGKEQDTDPKAVYIASEIDLIDKAEDNVKSGQGEQADSSNGVKNIEKQRKDLLDKYKAITGHSDVKKSIPESKINEAIAVYEGLYEDLGIKNIKEFPQKFKAEIKNFVAEIGGTYLGVFFDVPTKAIGISCSEGIGYYYYDTGTKEFDQYKITPLIH